MFRILSIFFLILFSAKLDAYTYNHNNLIKNTSSEQINYIHGKLTPVVIDKMNINTEKCKSVVSGIIISECSLRNNCKDMSLMDIKPIVMVRLSKIPGGNFISACNGFIDSEFNNYLLSQKGGVSFPKAVKNNSNLIDFNYKTQNYNSKKLTKIDMPKTINDLSFAQRLNNKKKGYEQWRPVYDNEGNCVKNCPYTIPNFLKPEIKVNKQEEKESSEDKPNKEIEKSPETQTETETPSNETSTPEIPVSENSTEEADIQNDDSYKNIAFLFYNDILENKYVDLELLNQISWDKGCSDLSAENYIDDDTRINIDVRKIFDKDEKYKKITDHNYFREYYLSVYRGPKGILMSDEIWSSNVKGKIILLDNLKLAKQLVGELKQILTGSCSNMKIYLVNLEFESESLNPRPHNIKNIKIISGPYIYEEKN